ncbi:MAG: DUF4367 domain-containing protein [Anaerolineae bacterium]
MNERDWADRFSREVDSPLNEAGRTDSKPIPTEYRQTLDLARTLVTTDFSAESQVRQTLRRRLLNQVDAREGWQRRKEFTMRTFFRKRRPAVILASVVLAALLVVTLAWPRALTAAAQGIYNVIQRIVVGPYTEVVQVEFQDEPSEPPTLSPDVWVVETEIGGFAGNVLPGVEPTVHSVTDFVEAQELTSFHLRAPNHLPEGYTLREIKLAAGNAFLFYGGAGHDIIVVQMLVGPQPSDDPNVGIGVMGGWFTNGPVEEVDLDGRPAAWLDGHSLTWEADSVSYTVGGLDLSLPEAIRIAESLE